VAERLAASVEGLNAMELRWLDPNEAHCDGMNWIEKAQRKTK
jgi:hypothetical protein